MLLGFSPPGGMFAQETPGIIDDKIKTASAVLRTTEKSSS